jgi:hypothetical protein
MKEVIQQKEFRRLTESYFAEKAKQAKGPQKLLVMLEMSKYLTAAREHGLSFEELRKDGFRFATV